MPVLDKEYLVGRVVETNYLSSRVLLLNDLNSRIPVTFGEDGVQAILKGSGGSRPVLEYLPEGYVVEGGIEVFTSGKDRIKDAIGDILLTSDSNATSYNVVIEAQKESGYTS